MKGKTFTWNDRLTLINHYKPTDEQACHAFGIQQAELDVARNQLKAGVFSISSTLDVESYGSLFASVGTEDATATSTKAPARTKPTMTSTTNVAPETATAKVREKAKRGRKGDKIRQAFTSIPSTPTAAEDFAKTHGVSIAVLRQSKRFDTTGIGGTVKVKKEKASKTLMIWRETA